MTIAKIMLVTLALLTILFLTFEFGRQYKNVPNNETTEQLQVIQPKEEIYHNLLASKTDLSDSSVDEKVESSILTLISDVSIPKNLKTIASKALEESNVTELIETVSRFSFLTQDELQIKSNPKEYLSRLLDVAMSAPENISDTTLNGQAPSNANQENYPINPVYFSQEVLYNNQATMPESIFYSNIGAIYACFDLDQNLLQNQVIVRWFDLTRNSLISFNRLRVDPQYFSQYVWFAPSSHWQEGEYHVAVYLNNDSVSQIAEGRFLIVQH